MNRPSLRCRLFLWVLHNRHLLRLQWKKEAGPDWGTALPEVRRQAEASARLLGRMPRGVAAEPVRIGGMDAEWISPAGAARDRAVLYFHGGGYVMGSVPAHRGIVAKFVQGGRTPALLFGYRLAPEHPFPAALEDALEAYRWLVDQGIPPVRIVFAGDSAGGGLCLATLLALKDRGQALPSAAAVLSPWVDLACSGESYRSNAATCLSPPGSWQACRRHYAGDRDPRDPAMSPLYGDLRGLPPLLIHAGGAEILRSDAESFAHKAREAGVDVALRIGPGLCHCYPACAPMFPEAVQAMEEIRAFLARHGGAAAA